MVAGGDDPLLAGLVRNLDHRVRPGVADVEIARVGLSGGRNEQDHKACRPDEDQMHPCAHCDQPTPGRSILLADYNAPPAAGGAVGSAPCSPRAPCSGISSDAVS